MANKKVKQYDQKFKEDIASFKASMAFIIFCLIIFLTASNIENNRATYDFRHFLDNNIWMLIIPFGIFAAAAVLRIIAYKKGADESCSYFSTRDFLGLSFLFLVYSLTFTATNSVLMYVMVVIGFALGYYSKHFFGADFYIVTLMNVAIAFGLWLKFGNKGWGTTLSTLSVNILFTLCGITAILIVVFAVARLVRRKGSAGIADKALAVFGITRENTPFGKLCLIPVFVSLVLGIALALVLQFAPIYLTLLVAEIILLVQYVALGVFYTVKLINQ